MDTVPATCRWLLTLDDSGQPDPSEYVDSVVRELIQQAKDPKLRLLDVAKGSLVLMLESTWEGMLAIDEQLVRQQLSQLGGRTVKRIDPLFDEGFIARLTARTKKDPLVRFFARRYGPVLDKAVTNVLRRASWSKYTHGDLLDEIWIDFLNRIPHILREYDRAVGDPEAYFYRVGQNKARDFLRTELRKEYASTPRKDEGQEDRGTKPKPAAAPARSYQQRFVGIEDRKLRLLPATDSGAELAIDELPPEKIEQLRAELKRDSDQGKTPAERQTWALFLDLYYEGLPTEDLMAKYQLKREALYQRRHRLRDKIQRLWRKMQKP